MEHSALNDVETTAAFLGVKKSWLYARHRELGIPSFKIGQAVRFRRSDVEAWLTRQAAA